MIGKRLEKVEVPAVDQRHVHRRPSKLANSLQASEATADDDDAVARTLRAYQSRSSLSGGHAARTGP